MLGCFSALASFQFAGRDQDEEYQTMTPFEGQVSQSTGIMHGSMMITDACEDPATLVAWADQLFTQVGGMLYWLGVEGNSYVNNDDGTWSWNIGGPIGDDIATVREKGTLKARPHSPASSLITGLQESRIDESIWLHSVPRCWITVRLRFLP